MISTLGMAQKKLVKTSIYSPKLISEQLPQSVNEQSGMLWHKNLFWVINDSDCMPNIIAYNINGKLKKTIRITNAENKDWEDLAEDDTYIYIGDFGNNRGGRKDLRVLRILKSDMVNKTELTVDFLTFVWADQQNFRQRNMKHNFDCEAFFAFGDSLYLFSKNWADKKTRLYSMSKRPGNYQLKPIAEFDVNFMVTGADITADGKTVALIGYKNYRTYMMLLNNFDGHDFFAGKALRLDLESMGRAQTEGIVFTDKKELYISTEETKRPQALYKVDWEKILKTDK